MEVPFPTFFVGFVQERWKVGIGKSVKLFGSGIVINEDACLCICRVLALKVVLYN